MKTRISLLRAILIGAIFAVAVYIHGEADSTVIERFSKLSYYDSNTWLRNQWLGIPTQQNPNDAWVIQEIIAEVKPDYIVETGTLLGGSAVLWAMVLREVNPAGKVITIDIEDNAARARQTAIARSMITFMVGSSTDPKIVSKVVHQVRGKRGLVILDSDHRMEHVLKELEVYAPLVSKHSYLIVQDSNVNGHPVWSDFGPGPMEAIEAFLMSNGDFEPDRDRERLLYTTNPRGYLKRLSVAPEP